MTLSIVGLALVVSFVFVFFKAFQQLNVVYSKYAYILPVSLGMAFCEVTIVTLVVTSTIWIAIPIAIGSSAGAILSMIIHKRIR